MPTPKGGVGTHRPIRGVPGSIKKLVEELKVEAQSQEINNTNQQSKQMKTSDELQLTK